MPSTTSLSRPRIVIVGAGFGGLAAAKGFANAAVDVVVIDRQNHHLFQPLLYQVATAALSPADIASPIRAILARQANTRVVLAEVLGVDLNDRAVLAEGRRFPFDRLIIATGARHAYFGHDEWEVHAPGLKRVDDAIALRKRILLAFERAEAEEDDEERRRLLTFVIVGGGPTGVEMAGAIADLARRTLPSEFRAIDFAEARIILIEAGPRVLPTFDPSLSLAAARALKKLAVEVRLGYSVTLCDADGVIAGGHRVEARTLVWAAGVMASKAGRWLDARTDHAGRVFVGADLTLPGNPDVFVLGDAANVMSAGGHSAARHRAGRQATGGLCRGQDSGGTARQGGGPVPLSRLRFSRRNRPQYGGGGNGTPKTYGICGLGPLVRRSYLFPDRLPQPLLGRAQLGLELPHPPTLGSAHHRLAGGFAGLAGRSCFGGRRGHGSKRSGRGIGEGPAGHSAPASTR